MVINCSSFLKEQSILGYDRGLVRLDFSHCEDWPMEVASARDVLITPHLYWKGYTTLGK